VASNQLRLNFFGINAQIFDGLRDNFATDEIFFRERIERADDGALGVHFKKPAQARAGVAAAKTIRAQREQSARNPRRNLVGHSADVVGNGDERPRCHPRRRALAFAASADDPFWFRRVASADRGRRRPRYSSRRVVALVGESGSGKSLIAHTIAGILDPAAKLDADRLTLAGTDILANGWDQLRGRKVGIVFQNSRAALNPIRSIGRQLADVFRAHGTASRADLGSAVIAALTDVRIPDPERRMNAYPGELSGGMCQRVMLAIALAGDPSLLIADEPTTGLDATTQSAILALLLERARARRMAAILITHDLELARAYAERIVVMHAGQIVEDAPASALFSKPRHPYSALLIAATPARARSVDALAGIPGNTPVLDADTPACRFADRCERAEPLCRTVFPSRRLDTEGHSFHCWRPL